jgi:hypothetical protein
MPEYRKADFGYGAMSHMREYRPKAKKTVRGCRLMTPSFAI